MAGGLDWGEYHAEGFVEGWTGVGTCLTTPRSLSVSLAVFFSFSCYFILSYLFYFLRTTTFAPVSTRYFRLFITLYFLVIDRVASHHSLFPIFSYSQVSLGNTSYIDPIHPFFTTIKYIIHTLTGIDTPSPALAIILCGAGRHRNLGKFNLLFT